MKEKYKYKTIRNNIWQIAEDNGVFCTLIKGNNMALLIDTGYGHRNLKKFVENSISTPYMVINSHGHPDHIGGNYLFETVYAAKNEFDVIKYFENKNFHYQLNELSINTSISLGDLTVEVVALSGHTKGSIGFLIKEESILISGDALNEGLWLFNYGSLKMNDLYQTLKETMQFDFTTYLCGHSNLEYPKNKLLAHIKNIQNLKIDKNTKQDTIGFETYCSKYEDENGKSEITFTIDRL